MDISKEEKKAISIVENIKFKKYKIYIAKEMKDEIRFYQTEEERKAIDIVLNLIEKLQKENKKKDKRIICLTEYNKDIKKDLKEVYDEIKNSNVFEEEEHFKAYVLRTLEDIL